MRRNNMKRTVLIWALSLVVLVALRPWVQAKPVIQSVFFEGSTNLNERLQALSNMGVTSIIVDSGGWTTQPDRDIAKSVADAARGKAMKVIMPTPIYRCVEIDGQIVCPDVEEWKSVITTYNDEVVRDINPDGWYINWEVGIEY